MSGRFSTPPQRAILIGLGAFVLLGLSDGAIGTVWPDLRDDFGRTDGSFGQVFACLAGGYLIASVASGHISERFGMTTAFRMGSTLAALAFGVIGMGSSWATTLVGFTLLGLGNGTLDSALNAWIAIKRKQRAMGLLHGFYGVGASAGPLVASAFVAGGGDRWGVPFWIFAVLQAGIVVASPLAREGFDDTPDAPDVEATRSRTVEAPSYLLVLLLGWFFLYVGVEVSAGQWSFTLLSEARNTDEVLASAFVASYWGGLTVGRFLLAFGGDRVAPEVIMSRASALAVVSAAIFAADPAGLGGFALPLLGFAFSVMFPAVVNRTPIYLGADRAARIVGYQLATSSAGAIIVPTVIGLLVGRTSQEALGWVSLVVVLMMAAMWAAVRASAPTESATPAS